MTDVENVDLARPDDEKDAVFSTPFPVKKLPDGKIEIGTFGSQRASLR